MREDICVIYDVDERYACKLMNIIDSKKNMKFKTMVFTNEEALFEYLTDNIPEVMIVSEESVTDRLRHSNVKKLIVLTEEMSIDRVSESFGEDVSGIYKYQSSDNICREVMNYCGRSYVMAESNANVIGIYSPISSTYKTSLSMAVANALGKTKKVLYINFEEYAGLEDILSKSQSGNLSDAIYYYKIGKDNFVNKLDCVTGHIGEFDYLAPVESADDVTYVSTSEWIEFISYIGNCGIYECIVIDIANAVKEQWQLIEHCNKVFMPIKADYLSQKKVNDFEKYYLSTGKEDCLDKIEKIVVPYDDSIRIGSGFIEHLEYSILGNFAKGIING